MANSQLRRLARLIPAALACGTAPLATQAQNGGDQCDQATQVAEGVYSFNNILATGGGPNPCNNIGATDVWYCYSADCTRPVTFSLCNSNFDTVLAIYANNCSCPAALPALVCNDDFCDVQSRATINAVRGQRYLVQIGGSFGLRGAGQLEITAPECPGACCVGTTCTLEFAADCTAAGGQFQGQGVPCAGPAGNPRAYSSGAINLPIPDGDLTGIAHTLVVPDALTLADANIYVELDHTFIADLTIWVARGSEEITLWRTACSSQDNLRITFDDEGVNVVCASPTVGNVRPQNTGGQPLSAFDNDPALGEWTLRVRDEVGGESGTLREWRVIVDELLPSPCAVPCAGRLRGDTNTDGMVNNFDIDPFVLAIASPDAYILQYCAGDPQCLLCHADLDGNGLVNNFDINPFVDCLANLPSPGEPCLLP
ncbi:MAG: proprotein convertase P-domain-containing protein [Phycisphaerae bacterium]